MRGGSRSGAGRPKGEGSKVIRVPLGILDEVEGLIAAYRNDDDYLISKYTKVTAAKAAKASSDKVDKNILFYCRKKFDSLNRAERRGLIKQFGDKESVLKHMVSETKKLPK